MQNITIAGNCTKDAELRTTQGGTKVAGFSVAVNGFSNGEKTTNYYDVSMWGKRGENVVQFAKKGAKICVTGELGKREHNGNTYLTVNGSDFTPMGGGSSNEGGGQGGSQGGYGSGGGPNSDLEDSIPFAPETRI